MIIDPFTIPQAVGATPQKGNNVLTLYELNAHIRSIVRHELRPHYWVAAELSEVRVASNGHCYVEFVQKDETGRSLIAKARGTIWQHTYRNIAARFQQVTGKKLTAGMKILAQVSADFHELYGFSLSVSDIDPTYTLGDMERQRREIIEQLKADGIIDLNKELRLPAVVSRIAVISSATAAGYGDFCNQLEQSGYPFRIQLFPAIMQGDNVESSIVAALDEIAEQANEWDTVVIIRGGGSTTDLSGFDSYLLASVVAQFPLPILTGIGHERDDTIVDLVAHLRLKTPTAVAAFLIERRRNEESRLSDLETRMTHSISNIINAEQSRLDRLQHQFALSANRQSILMRQRFERNVHRYEKASARYFSHERQALMLTQARFEARTEQLIREQQHRIDLVMPRLTTATERWLAAKRHQLDIMQKSIQLASPDRILALGFSITLKNGRTVRNASQLTEGDIITTRFAQGTITSTVGQHNKE